MPPAPTRQLYINCKYMSIKKRRKTTKNKRTATLSACGEIGFRGCQDCDPYYLQLILRIFSFYAS